VTLKPETSYVNVTRSCLTTGSRKEHAIVLARKPGANDILVGGKCWIGSPPLEEFITIHNPALYLATVFKEALERAGVKVVGAVRLADRPMKEAETPENEVASFGSWLSGTIAVANKRSQNFYAEQLFKVLGALKGGVGSFETGAAGVREFLNRLDGEGKSFVVTDGSGLSKTNRLTPALMTALLRHMYEHKFRDAFLGSLAVPCEEGSLEKRFKDEPYRSAVIAKTGYVAGASCLSGYAATRKERMLAFAIFMNRFNAGNPHMHALQDKICRALVDME
jgi:D-alanyl-D-alanine carboxypeptidase/D-alanyl-D-alanine-endopeptidase (penicillin-binding protein 4)